MVVSLNMDRKWKQYILCLVISVNVTFSQNSCDPNPCERGGECFVLEDDFFCLCPLNVEGKTCDLIPVTTDPCDPNPCQRGGICFTRPGDFFCLCPVDVRGKTCQLPVPETHEPTSTIGYSTTTLVDGENMMAPTSMTTEDVFVQTSSVVGGSTESTLYSSTPISETVTTITGMSPSQSVPTPTSGVTNGAVFVEKIELVYLEGSLSAGTTVRWFYDDTDERVVHFKLETKASEDDEWNCDAVISETTRMITLDNLETRGVRFVRISVVREV